MRYFSYSRSVYFVVKLLVILSTPVITRAITESKFSVATGFRFFQGTQLKTVYSSGISAIFCSSKCSSECNSATYSVKYKTCITFVEKFYNSSIVWSQDQDWVVLFRTEQRVLYGDWTMVFRAQKEVNISLFSVWNATGKRDDSPLTSGVLNGCCRLDNMGGCKRHFRSSILDNWSNIKEVKFSVYINGSEVKSIVYNGTSTNRDSWFNQSSILITSWSSMKNDTNIYHFELPGLSTYPTNRRRFVISGQYNSCFSDKAYFLAFDQSTDYCSAAWFLNLTNFPVFIYAKNSSMVALSSTPKGYMVADVIAVFVKFQ